MSDKIAIYLNFISKGLFALGGILLVLGFAFTVLQTGGWKIISIVGYWKIIVAGLFTMLLGMIFYILAFLRSGK